MSKAFISIQEAADLSGKSIQTIRRAIKSKKFSYKKKKTPQGFNYLIDKTSLCEVYGLALPSEVVDEITKKETKKTKETKIESEDTINISADDFHNFTKTMEKLISQHADERQNFLRLVNTLQEKVFLLENQINLLKAPEKKWYQVWK